MVDVSRYLLFDYFMNALRYSVEGFVLAKLQRRCSLQGEEMSILDRDNDRRVLFTHTMALSLLSRGWRIFVPTCLRIVFVRT